MGDRSSRELSLRICKKWGIYHDPSSPYHHVANGYAEAAVKGMKSLVKKAAGGNTKNVDFMRGLIAFRNTPRSMG
jgi:hypothetical protein